MPAWPPGWERPNWPKRAGFADHTIAGTIGVRSDASLDACEGAYRAQARSAHPDRPGGSAEKMQQLNRAIQLVREGRA